METEGQTTCPKCGGKIEIKKISHSYYVSTCPNGYPCWKRQASYSQNPNQGNGQRPR
jgi:hypothetical protein